MPAASEPSRIERRRVVVPLFLALLLTYAYGAHQNPYNVNAVSRMGLAACIATEGRLAIEPFDQLTNDKAFRDGRTYSDKAPGLSFAAVPIVAAVVAATGGGTAEELAAASPLRFASLTLVATPLLNGVATALAACADVRVVLHDEDAEAHVALRPARALLGRRGGDGDREPDDDLRPLPLHGGARLDVAAVQLDEAARQREAEPGARLAGLRVRSVHERLEEAGAQLGREVAAVGDAGHGVPVHRVHRRDHAAAARRAADRVLEQAREHLREPPGIGVHQDGALPRPDGEAQRLAARGLRGRVGGPPERGAEVHRLAVQLDAPLGDPREVEEVVHEPPELPGLPRDHRGVARDPGVAARLEQVPRGGHRGERVAQLVADRGEELVLAAVRVLERCRLLRERLARHRQLAVVAVDVLAPRLELLRLGADLLPLRLQLLVLRLEPAVRDPQLGGEPGEPPVREGVLERDRELGPRPLDERRRLRVEVADAAQEHEPHGLAARDERRREHAARPHLAEPGVEREREVPGDAGRHRRAPGRERLRHEPLAPEEVRPGGAQPRGAGERLALHEVDGARGGADVPGDLAQRGLGGGARLQGGGEGRANPALHGEPLLAAAQAVGHARERVREEAELAAARGGAALREGERGPVVPALHRPRRPHEGERRTAERAHRDERGEGEGEGHEERRREERPRDVLLELRRAGARRVVPGPLGRDEGVDAAEQALARRGEPLLCGAERRGPLLEHREERVRLRGVRPRRLHDGLDRGAVLRVEVVAAQPAEERAGLVERAAVLVAMPRLAGEDQVPHGEGPPQDGALEGVRRGVRWIDLPYELLPQPLHAVEPAVRDRELRGEEEEDHGEAAVDAPADARAAEGHARASPRPGEGERCGAGRTKATHATRGTRMVPAQRVTASDSFRCAPCVGWRAISPARRA